MVCQWLNHSIIHGTKSDNALSQTVSCISQTTTQTAWLIPPLRHFIICNLKAPPPPLRAPYRPNSGSPFRSRGRQESDGNRADHAELYIISTALCVRGVVHGLSSGCLSSIYRSLMFRVCSRFCEPAPFLDTQRKPVQYLP